MLAQFLTFILLSQIVVCAKKSLPSQFEASCPEGCKCGTLSIECHDLHETTTELFHHALPKIYPELDSLIVTGNNFGELPAESIFTGNDHHQRLSYLNLSNNGIQSFGQQTFIGAPRVEYFYLSNNKINAFIDDEPLKYLTSLKLLDLTSAFDKKSSPRRKSDLLQALFKCDHDFVDLSEIILSDNNLEHIHKDTFCKVKGLTRLILRNNLLTSLEFDSGCLKTLSLLDMRQNRVYSVPSSLWKGLQLLNSLDFSKNPLHCDCNLQDFHEFAIDNAVSFLSQQETTCASPAAVRGKPLFDMEDNFCRGRASFLHWLILLGVAGAILYIYYWLRKSGRRLKVPSFMSGYTQLKSSSDETSAAATQPAFV